jgi:hypothetical protein
VVLPYVLELYLKKIIYFFILNYRDLIISGLTNLLESLKEQGVTDENSIKNKILNFLISQTNDNPKVKEALAPIIPGIIQAYNSLNLDQYKTLVNNTLNDILQLTNVLSTDATNGVSLISDKLESINTTAIMEYLADLLAGGNQNLTNQLLMDINEYLPILLNELKKTNGSIEELLPILENAIISQLAVLLNDPSLVNSTTPFADILIDIHTRMQAMNTSMLPPEIQTIIDNFIATLEQTKDFNAALLTAKNDILMYLHNVYMSDPNIPSTFKSPLFMKISGDFVETLVATKNLTAAFEVVKSDLLNAVADYINKQITTQLIPELVKAALENPDVPAILQTPQVEAIVTEFFVSLYEQRDLSEAFGSIQNDTLMFLYNQLMANPNVPSFLKNAKVQSVILEFLTTYQETKSFSEAFDSIKNETLQMLYEDLMADPDVPAFLKAASFQAIVKDFTTAYRQTHNLTAAFEASKESIITAAVTLLLTDTSQLPPMFQTPEAQEIISKFLTAYMQSMDAQAAFDAIKLDLVQWALNATLIDANLPAIIKSSEIQNILNEFLTTFVETLNISLALESVQGDAEKFLYDTFMANPNVPALLKNSAVQQIIGEFLTDYMKTMDLTSAFDSVKNETFSLLYQLFMSDPNVPDILKNPQVQMLLGTFLNNYMATKDIKMAFESISSDLANILYNILMNDPNVPEVFKNQEFQAIVADFVQNYQVTNSFTDAFKLTIGNLKPELQKVVTDEVKAFISGLSPQLFELIQNATNVNEIVAILEEYFKNVFSQLGSTTSSMPTTTQAPAKKSSSLLEFSILESINEKDLMEEIESFKNNIGRKIAIAIMNGTKDLAKLFLPGLWEFIKYDDDIILFTNDFFKWMNGRVVARLINLGFPEPTTTTTTTTTVSTSTTTTTTTTKTTTNAINQNVIDIINGIQNQNNLGDLIGPTNQPLQTLPIVIEWG